MKFFNFILMEILTEWLLWLISLFSLCAWHHPWKIFQDSSGKSVSPTWKEFSVWELFPEVRACQSSRMGLTVSLETDKRIHACPSTHQSNTHPAFYPSICSHPSTYSSIHPSILPPLIHTHQSMLPQNTHMHSFKHVAIYSSSHRPG